jgi:hypothetical protein
MLETTQLAKSKVTSGAEALLFSAFYGTTKVVP